MIVIADARKRGLLNFLKPGDIFEVEREGANTVLKRLQPEAARLVKVIQVKGRPMLPFKLDRQKVRAANAAPAGENGSASNIQRSTDHNAEVRRGS
jgi:hypothetical protein